MDFILTLLDVPSMCAWDYWNGVFQNAIGCAIGSGAAIYVAVLIYKKATKDSENSIAHAIELDEDNQLKSFAVMLENALRMARKQAGNIGLYIAELKKQPEVFPKMIVNPRGNLQAIMNSITVEKTGLTYMKRFPGNDSAREFTTILDWADYLNTEFYELHGLIARATINHDDRRIEISKVFDFAEKLVMEYILKNNGLGADAFLTSLRQIKVKFNAGRISPDDHQPILDLFFSPINRLLIERINSGITDDFTLELIYLTSRGIDYFGNISAGYKQFESEISGIKYQVDEAITKLESVTTKLLTSKYATLSK